VFQNAQNAALLNWFESVSLLLPGTSIYRSRYTHNLGSVVLNYIRLFVSFSLLQCYSPESRIVFFQLAITTCTQSYSFSHLCCHGNDICGLLMKSLWVYSPFIIQKWLYRFFSNERSQTPFEEIHKQTNWRTDIITIWFLDDILYFNRWFWRGL